MPVISEYQRQNLKSSVVGTPGADYSTGQALGAIAQDAKSMAGASFDLAVKRKQAMDANLVNEYALKAASEEEAAFNQFNQDQRGFIGSPADRVAMYDKMVAERSKARLESVRSNQEVFQRASQHEADIRLRNSQRQFQAASNNQVDLAVGSMINFQRQAEAEAARIGADTSMPFDEKRKQVDWILGNVDSSVKATSMVLSPDKAAALQAQKPAAVLTAMAMGMLSKDPAQLNLFLNEKGKDGKTAFERAGMPPDEIEKMRALAQQGINAFETRRQREEYAAYSKQISDIDRNILDGNDVEAFSLIQNLPEGKLKDHMYTAVLQRHVPANDKSDRVAELMDEYVNILADISAHKKKGDEKKGITRSSLPLESLVKFQEKVAEANALGYLEKETYKNYVTKILPAIQDKAQMGLGQQKAEAFAKGLGQGAEGVPFIARAAMWPTGEIIGGTWKAVSNLFKGDSDSAVGVHKDFLNRLDQIKDPSDDAVNKALREALSYHAKQRFPSLLGLSGTPNAVLTQDRELVSTGLQGPTGMPVSGKVKASGVRYELRPQIDRATGQPTGKMFRVGYDENNNPISKEEVNG